MARQSTRTTSKTTQAKGEPKKTEEPEPPSGEGDKDPSGQGDKQPPTEKPEKEPEQPSESSWSVSIKPANNERIGIVRRDRIVKNRFA